MNDEEWYNSEPRRLHIGSGTWYADGWINVDSHGDFAPNRAPDIIADAADLPFPDDYFDQIYMGHFLEHIPLDVMGKVLNELRRVAAPDCRVAVVGPAMDLAVAQGQPQWLLSAIEADEGDMSPGAHKWTATQSNTRIVLEEHGLIAHQVDVGEIRPPEWCNPNWMAKWQVAFLARWDNS